LFYEPLLYCNAHLSLLQNDSLNRRRAHLLFLGEHTAGVVRARVLHNNQKKESGARGAHTQGVALSFAAALLHWGKLFLCVRERAPFMWFSTRFFVDRPAGVAGCCEGD